jgi:hypothetical protein
MKPMHYFTLGLGFLAAVAMSVPAHAVTPTAGDVESTVSSRPTGDEGLVKLALFKQAYCSEYTDDCPFDNDNDDDGLQG